jgi:DeoR family fructose operon transcriptional repressor
MFSQERQSTIRKIVRERHRLNFAELQTLVPASPATLRRDLDALERVGHIIRTHGGVLDPAYVRVEPSFAERAGRHQAAKKLIAAHAIGLVPTGASVFVDAGSTCLEAGRQLAARGDVRLVTHSASLVAAALHGQSELLCIGGDLRKLSGAFTGGTALGVLRELRVQVAFIGASGLHPGEGASTTELSEADMKQEIIARATRVVLLADRSKWKNPSTVRFAGWNDFDDWITDLPPGPAAIARLRAGGTTVHKAGKN